MHMKDKTQRSKDEKLFIHLPGGIRIYSSNPGTATLFIIILTMLFALALVIILRRRDQQILHPSELFCIAAIVLNRK